MYKEQWVELVVIPGQHPGMNLTVAMNSPQAGLEKVSTDSKRLIICTIYPQTNKNKN